MAASWERWVFCRCYRSGESWMWASLCSGRSLSAETRTARLALASTPHDERHSTADCTGFPACSDRARSGDDRVCPAGAHPHLVLIIPVATTYVLIHLAQFFDAARKGDVAFMQAPLEAGLPANLTNSVRFGSGFVILAQCRRYRRTLALTICDCAEWRYSDHARRVSRPCRRRQASAQTRSRPQVRAYPLGGSPTAAWIITHHRKPVSSSRLNDRQQSPLSGAVYKNEADASPLPSRRKSRPLRPLTVSFAARHRSSKRSSPEAQVRSSENRPPMSRPRCLARNTGNSGSKSPGPDPPLGYDRSL